MERKELDDYLLKKPGGGKGTPFGEEVWVYKVFKKIFALVAWQENPLSLSLKCDPDLAQHLRATYPAVTPGYHMNKEHWNTILLDNSVPPSELLKMIDHSYHLVVQKLNKNDRGKLS